MNNLNARYCFGNIEDWLQQASWYRREDVLFLWSLPIRADEDLFTCWTEPSAWPCPMPPDPNDIILTCNCNTGRYDLGCLD